MKDRFGRKIDYIRLSLTDRCNLRCTYCMPEEGVDLMDHDDIMTYEELLKLCRVLISMGIVNFKLTGGEPLVRKGLVDFVRDLKNLEGCQEVTLTTNGILLDKMGLDLVEAGIDRINISLDTLDEEKFRSITRGGDLSRVLKGIQLLLDQGFENLKVNVVPTRPLDTKDLMDLISLAKEDPIDIRFIQLMPIGQGKQGQGFSKDELMAILEPYLGKAQAYQGKRGNGPAQYYSYPDLRGKVGFIDALDNKFCSDCNRIRLSASGFLKLCLHYNRGTNIRNLVSDLDEKDLAASLESILYDKPLMHKMGIEGVEGAEMKNMNQIGG